MPYQVQDLLFSYNKKSGGSQASIVSLRTGLCLLHPPQFVMLMSVLSWSQNGCSTSSLTTAFQSSGRGAQGLLARFLPFHEKNILLQDFCPPSLWPELSYKVTLTCKGDWAWGFTFPASMVDSSTERESDACGFWMNHSGWRPNYQIIKEECRQISFYCNSFYCVFFFINWKLVATLGWACLLAPSFRQHSLTLCLCVPFW